MAQNLPPGAAASVGQHPSGITPEQLEQLPPAVAHDFVVSYADALTPLYAYLIPLVAVGFVLAWFLKEKPPSTAVAGGDDGAAPQHPPEEEPGSHPSTDAQATVNPISTAHSVAGEQARETVVFGRVHDGTAPVTAVLTLTGHQGRQVDRTHTDAHGEYRLTAPRAGQYLLICTPPPSGRAVDGGTGGAVRYAAWVTVNGHSVGHDIVAERSADPVP